MCKSVNLHRDALLRIYKSFNKTDLIDLIWITVTNIKTSHLKQN